MKATELMIGDWVNCPNVDVKVGEIKQGRIECFTPHRISCEIERVTPISLTEDFFVANGWKKNGAYNDYILKNEDYDFVGYSFDNHHLRIRTNTEAGEQNIYVSVHNVHELQHALRLCGLIDLADNFKV